MTTPLTSIYTKFFSLIDDVGLHNLEDELKLEVLRQYLSKSCDLDCRFLKINSDDIGLDTIEVDVGIFESIEVFPYEISPTKQWILAHGMVIGYLSTKINRERLLREAIGDRDYRESSHGNQLQQLIKLIDMSKDELERYKIDYSFDDFEGFN